MKKTIAILLVFCLCTILCSCGNAQAGQKAGQKAGQTAGQTVKTTTLSTENWNKYLHIEMETQNYNCKETNVLGSTFAKGTADCVISISKSVPCNFSNVVIKIEVYSSTLFWEEETKTIDVHISADGNATKSVSFTSEQSLPGYLDKPNFSYRIVSVSGTVQVTS